MLNFLVQIWHIWRICHGLKLKKTDAFEEEKLKHGISSIQRKEERSMGKMPEKFYLEMVAS